MKATFLILKILFLKEALIMTINKIINTLISDIQNDCKSDFFGSFDNTFDRINGRLDDLLIISEIINDNALSKQINNAKNDLNISNINKIANDLSNLAIKTK